MMNVTAIAEELVQYETVTPVTDPAIFHYIQDVLADHGVDAEIHEIGGVYSLTAVTGVGEPHICLNGHVDVVPPGDGWDVTAPFEPRVQDGKLYGRGAADMKGGVAAEITAFIRLHEDPAFEGRATLMLVGDEETGSMNGTKALLQEHSDASFDYAIIGEPTDLDIQIGVRGLYWPEIEVRGESVHASRPHLAENVLTVVPAVLTALNEMELTYEADELLPEPNAEVTTVHTTGPQNSFPGTVRIGMDVRYVRSQSPEQIRADIREVLDSLDISYTLSGEHHGSAYVLEDETFKRAATSAVEAVTGETPEHITEGGISDGKFFARQDTPYIELGPSARETGHQPDEYCRVAELDRLATIYHRIGKQLEQSLS